MNGQLRDIHGLDPLPWWPPGPGWWIAALLALLMLLFTVLLLRQLVRYPPGSWRRDAPRELRRLQRRLGQQPAKTTASELSQLLRRIAMARFGRGGLASLAGDEWLHWLHDYDPNGFDWRGRGQLLLSLPYAPAASMPDTASSELRLLLAAARRLVAQSHEDVQRQRRRWWPWNQDV